MERLRIMEVVNKIKKAFDDIKKIEEKIKAAEEQIEGLDPKDDKKKDQINKGITNKQGEIKEKHKEIVRLKSKYIEKQSDEVKKNREKAEEKLESEKENLAELEDTKVNRRERDKIEGKMDDLEDDIQNLEKEEKKLEKSSFDDIVQETEDQYIALKEKQIGLPDYRFLKTEAKRKEEQGKEEQVRLRKTTKEFRRMKKRGVTVEDLEEAAKISSGTISKFYDTQERINNKIERGQRIRLLGEIIAGSTQIAFHSTKRIMAAPILELRKGVRYSIAENISLGLYRIRSASRGLLFKKGPLAIGKGTWGVPSVEKAKEQAKKYKTPKDVPDPNKTKEEIIERFKKSMDENTKKVLKSIGDPTSSPDKITEDLSKAAEDVVEEDEEFRAETDENLEGILESMDDPVELASETADRAFKHMTEGYEFYVHSGANDEEGINKLFKTMREAGLKPEIFEKESAYLKQVILNLKIEEWTKKIATMSKEKAEQELETFWDTAVRATTGEDLGRTDIIKKLTENIYIGFLLSEKLRKRN